MADRMTHWDRVRAALSGAAVDRPPVSMWRHFFGQENSAADLAGAMLAFQREYDWDFMKVNPRATYHNEDWGVDVRFSDSDAVDSVIVDRPVKRPEDWDAIEPLDVGRGVLGEHLESLRLIANVLDGEVPFLMTIFSPLSIVGRLTESEDAMTEHLKRDPAKAHRVLDIVTETYTRFATECLSIGASGIFFATTRWGSYDRMTDEQYAEFGRPYDLRLLEALPEAEFNVLHVCGSNNMLSTLSDYPVAALNWDTQDGTNVWLDEGERSADIPVIGGISHKDALVNGSPADVEREVARVRRDMSDSRWMLGPGCTYSHEAPEANIRSLSPAYTS